MKKQYPYLEDAYYENPLIGTKKRNFLSKLNDLVIQKQYVKITLLNWEEKPLKEIQGQITSGSISKDGSAAMRTTGTLAATFDAESYSVEDASADFSINKKIYVEIGVRNDTDEYEEYPILWFPQGVFFIGSVSITSATGGVNISISLKDKMACLNGDVGGKFSSTTILDVEDDVDENNNYVSRKVLIYDLIVELVNHFGGEPLNNIIIEDVDLEIKRVMKWNGDNPLYLQQCEYIDETGNSQISYRVTTDTTNTEEKDWQTISKYEVGEDVGYIYDDFYYTSDLEAAPGDSVVTILDKIKSYLGNYEYFYDAYGLFHFREIKNYLNTTQAKDVMEDMDTHNYLIQTNSSKSSFSFSDDSNIISISVTPQYDNIKNDFIIQGQKQSSTNATYPVMYHLAIDNKPTTGVIEYENFCVYQDEDEDVKKGTFPVFIQKDQELPTPGNPSYFYLVDQSVLKDNGYEKEDTSEIIKKSENMLKSIIVLDEGNTELTELNETRKSIQSQKDAYIQSYNKTIDKLTDYWTVFQKSRYNFINDNLQTKYEEAQANLQECYKNNANMNFNSFEGYAALYSLDTIYANWNLDSSKKDEANVPTYFSPEDRWSWIDEDDSAYDRKSRTSWSQFLKQEYWKKTQKDYRNLMLDDAYNGKSITTMIEDYVTAKVNRESFFIPGDFFFICGVQGVMSNLSKTMNGCKFLCAGTTLPDDGTRNNKSISKKDMEEYLSDCPERYYPISSEGYFPIDSNGWSVTISKSNCKSDVLKSSSVDDECYLIDELGAANTIVYEYPILSTHPAFASVFDDGEDDGEQTGWIFSKNFEGMNFEARLQAVDAALSDIGYYLKLLRQEQAEKERSNFWNNYPTNKAESYAFCKTVTLDRDYNIESKMVEFQEMLKTERRDIVYQIKKCREADIEFHTKNIERYQKLAAQAKKNRDTAINDAQSALEQMIQNAKQLIEFQKHVTKSGASGVTPVISYEADFINLSSVDFEQWVLSRKTKNTAYDYTSIANGQTLDTSKSLSEDCFTILHSSYEWMTKYGWYDFLLNNVKLFFKDTSDGAIDVFGDSYTLKTGEKKFNYYYDKSASEDLHNYSVIDISLDGDTALSNMQNFQDSVNINISTSYYDQNMTLTSGYLAQSDALPWLLTSCSCGKLWDTTEETYPQTYSYFNSSGETHNLWYWYGTVVNAIDALGESYYTNDAALNEKRNIYFPLVKAIYDAYIEENKEIKTNADKELQTNIEAESYKGCVNTAEKYTKSTEVTGYKYPEINWSNVNSYYKEKARNGIMDMSEVYTTAEKIQSDYDDLKTKQSNSTIDNEDLLTYELLGSFLTQYSSSYILPIYGEASTGISLLEDITDNSSSYVDIKDSSYGLVQWSESVYNFIPIAKFFETYKCKDWRTEIYLRGMLAKINGTDSSQYYENLVLEAQKTGSSNLTGIISHADIVNPDFYFEELDAFWPQIYDLENQTWLAYEEGEEWDWHTTLTQGSYYLDFVDAANSGLNEFSIGNIGRRTDVVSDTDINCLFEPQIPDIIYINLDDYTDYDNDEDKLAAINKVRSKADNNGLAFIQLDSDLYYALYTGGNNNAAYDQVKYELYTHSLYQKTLSVTAIPAWWLQPNTRCTVNDKVTNTYGDFNIQSISLTLGAGSSMSVTMNEALERI